jgi:hypothetical protein
MIDKMTLIDKKVKVQGEYIASVESNNYTHASFLRGKLALINELLLIVE